MRALLFFAAMLLAGQALAAPVRLEGLHDRLYLRFDLPAATAAPSVLLVHYLVTPASVPPLSGESVTRHYGRLEVFELSESLGFEAQVATPQFVSVGPNETQVIGHLVQGTATDSVLLIYESFASSIDVELWLELDGQRQYPTTAVVLATDPVLGQRVTKAAVLGDLLVLQSNTYEVDAPAGKCEYCTYQYVANQPRVAAGVDVPHAAAAEWLVQVARYESATSSTESVEISLGTATAQIADFSYGEEELQYGQLRRTSRTGALQGTTGGAELSVALSGTLYATVLVRIPNGSLQTPVVSGAEETRTKLCSPIYKCPDCNMSVTNAGTALSLGCLVVLSILFFCGCVIARRRAPHVPNVRTNIN